jgi:hypothetical protein
VDGHGQPTLRSASRSCPRAHTATLHPCFSILLARPRASSAQLLRLNFGFNGPFVFDLEKHSAVLLGCASVGRTTQYYVNFASHAAAHSYDEDDSDSDDNFSDDDDFGDDGFDFDHAGEYDEDDLDEGEYDEDDVDDDDHDGLEWLENDEAVAAMHMQEEEHGSGEGGAPLPHDGGEQPEPPGGPIEAIEASYDY